MPFKKSRDPPQKKSWKHTKFKYTVIRADNQPTLSFVGQPPPKIQKQDPPPSPPSSKTEHTSVVEEQSSVDVDDSENQDDLDFKVNGPSSGYFKNTKLLDF